ncbi:hypothetical protein NKH77_46815 [Streptomyces sp. M19]
MPGRQYGDGEHEGGRPLQQRRGVHADCGGGEQPGPQRDRRDQQQREYELGDGVQDDRRGVQGPVGAAPLVQAGHRAEQRCQHGDEDQRGYAEEQRHSGAAADVVAHGHPVVREFPGRR